MPPFNQDPPEECRECGGVWTEDGHEPLGNSKQQECADCGTYWEDEVRDRCPECGSDDLQRLPCPNDGLDSHDYDQQQKTAHAEMKMEEQRLQKAMENE